MKLTVSILEIVGNNKNKINKKLDKNNKRLYNEINLSECSPWEPRRVFVSIQRLFLIYGGEIWKQNLLKHFESR